MTGVDESAFQRVRVGSVSIAWTELGPLESVDRASGDEPPLVFVHGFTGHRDDWIGVMPILGRQRRVLALDLRGHGDSDSPSESSAYSFELFLEDLQSGLDQLEIEVCDLLGHSVGGMIAQRFAYQVPERLRSLILMGTAAEMPPSIPEAGVERDAAIAAAKGMAGLQELAEKASRAAKDPTQALWGERYWAHQRRRLCAMTPESYRGFSAVLHREASFLPNLSELNVPTTVIVGEEDDGFWAGSHAIAEALPAATSRFRVIQTAGHHPHQENPGAWFEAMAEHQSWVEHGGAEATPRKE